MKRILILSANPHDTARLRLEKEVHDIREGLKRSTYREQFELIYIGAVTLRDFYLHMLEIKPHIVHFSGHGGGEHGLVLEDDNGKAQFLQTEQLVETFRLFASDGLECVVLNACYSEVQARSINQFVPYVIGMNQAIGDRSAIAFGLAFYDALGAGRAVNFAFDLAKAQLIGFQENQKPVLLINQEAISRYQLVQQEKEAGSSEAASQKPDKDYTSGISLIAGDNSKQIGNIGKVENLNM